MLAVGFPEEKKKPKPSGRPAGWHFMAEFVDKDGNVFHKNHTHHNIFPLVQKTEYLQHDYFQILKPCHRD